MNLRTQDAHPAGSSMDDPPAGASIRTVGSRPLARIGFASVVALLGGACSAEPGRPTFEWTVDPATEAALVAEDFTRADLTAAQIDGALTSFFGKYESPGYALLDSWLDDERDPNDAWYELAGDAVDAVRAGNVRRFRAQLVVLRSLVEGSSADAARAVVLPKPLRAEEAWSRWNASFGALIAGEVALGDLHPDSPTTEESSDDEPTFSWGDEALYFWQSYYPSLTESAELFRIRCLACHGPSGAGDGPTGRYLDPKPRDFRNGVFKWGRVKAGARPRRADLLHVLREGVRGTSMPSFKRLSRGELEGLVDWVRLLALRGETEKLMTAFVVADEGALAHARSLDAYASAWDKWDAAPSKVGAIPALAPRPSEMTRARITRGADLFAGVAANCAACHGKTGAGDGDAIWETAEDGERRRRVDLWGNPTFPRNLAHGVFRGGSRPADLFRRIKYGIGGTIMPAADDSLTDDDLWSLVAYVLSLSDASMGGGS